MMQQLKVIDGQPFIATRVGKRDQLQPPAEVISAAHKRITDAKTMLTSLAVSRAEQQDRLEDVLLGGGSTKGARKELETIAELESDQVREIDHAIRDIDEVERLVDDHRAEQIERADIATTVALCQPLDDFLKENQ